MVGQYLFGRPGAPRAALGAMRRRGQGTSCDSKGRSQTLGDPRGGTRGAWGRARAGFVGVGAREEPGGLRAEP